MNSGVPATTDVLIVGAGPTGLAAALSLLRHSPASRRITIVDALSTGQNDSRALVIHSRTMEALKTINASAALQETGITAHRNVVQNTTRVLLSGDFSKLSNVTAFPSMLLISQADTEAVLSQLLLDRGVRVLRPVTVLGMKELVGDDSRDGYKFRVTLEGGESILTKFIIGCDGARSSIRSLSNISFNEPKLSTSTLRRALYSAKKALPSYFALADLKFDPLTTPDKCLPKNLIITFTPRGFFVFVLTTNGTNQRKSGNRLEEQTLIYRIVLNVTEEEAPFVKDPNTNMAFFQNILDKYHATHDGDSDRVVPKIKAIVWANAFKARYAIASTSYKVFSNGGAMLLAGDAAHIHTPAGGQGMNIGICDGIQASEALHSFMLTNSPSTLEQYSNRRMKVALATIQMAARLSWMWSLRNPVARTLRDWTIWTSGKFPNASREFAWQLSGLRDIGAM